MTLSPQLIWFLLGVVFLIGEMALPGFILIFFTVGCWIAAIITWGTNITVTGQVILFVVVSLVSLFGLRKYSLQTFKGSIRQDEDDGGMESKRGKTAQVTQAITPHLPGEIKMGGTFWRAVADEEIAKGESVIIVSQTADEGLTFKVKPL